MKIIRRKHKPGDYNMVCDRSGQTFPASEMRREWTGMWVHESYWEPRHPQDFVRGRADDQKVPVSRPDVDPVSLLVTASASGTSSSATITIVSADIGSQKHCSRLVLTLSMTSYDSARQNLYVAHSTDNVTYTDVADVVLNDALASSIESTAFSVPVSENARYWKVELRDNAGSVTYSGSIDVRGSDIASVSVGDL